MSEECVATLWSAREGRGLTTFVVATCCTGTSFTHVVCVVRLLQKTDKVAANLEITY